MKNFKTLAVRIAIAFALLTSVVVVIETQTSTKMALAGGGGPLCGVTDAACVAYLAARGYAEISVISYNGCNRRCDTSNSYDTWVFVSNGIITGWEDISN